MLNYMRLFITKTVMPVVTEDRYRKFRKKYLKVWISQLSALITLYSIVLMMLPFQALAAGQKNIEIPNAKKEQTSNARLKSDENQLVSEKNQLVLESDEFLAKENRPTATALENGDVLIVSGGSAQIYFAGSDKFGATGAPITPRENHAAVRLNDGRVLITGGSGSGAGALRSTEIFDPSTGSFTPAAEMNVARKGHSATVLADGKILIAGGDSAEIYDASTDSFSSVSAKMQISRENHSAILLNDGRVLIVGGVDKNGASLKSAEIFDTSTSEFTAAAAMVKARKDTSLRALPDGKIQIIGGANEPSMEVFDPNANLFGAAVKIPANGNDFPELFNDIMSSPTRAAVIGKSFVELPQSEQALVYSDGNGLKTGQIFAGSKAAITTENLSYPVGSAVVVSGKGFQPSETVELIFYQTENPNNRNFPRFPVQADENGAFRFDGFSSREITGTLLIAAKGTISGEKAQTPVSNLIDSVDVRVNQLRVQTSNLYVSAGATLNASATVQVGSSSVWQSTSWRISNTETDPFACADTDDHGAGTFTEPFLITAPSASGDYDSNFRINQSACPGSAIFERSYSQKIHVVSGSTTTMLSAASSSSYGDSVTFTATVSPNVSTGTVDFYEGSTLLSSQTLSSGTASFSTASLSSPLEVGAHSIKAYYRGNPTTPGSEDTFSHTVNKATPTITWANPADIVYGTALSSTQLNAVFAVPGSCDYTPAAGDVLSAGPHTLSVTCTPTDTTHYTTATKDVSINVLTAPLTITASSHSVSYGDAAPTISPSYSGFVNGDSSSSLTTQPTCLTTYTQGASVSGSPFASRCSGAVDPNYSISYVDGTVTVAAVSLTITASSHTVGYGDAVPTISPSYSGFVNGDTFASLTTQPTCSTTYTQGASVSGSPYPSSCSGATSTNYSISYANGSVTVNQALLTITASSHTVSYGDAAPTITASYSGFVNGDTAPATLPTCLTTYAQGSPVSGSTYSSSCSGAADPNYSISYAPGTVSVNPVALTITASSHSLSYGAVAPTITPSYSGFVNGDTFSSLTTQPTCSTTYMQGSPVSGSPYSSSCSGAVDSNYTISYTNGSVTVNPAALTITASSHTVGYGDAVPTISPSYSGFVNGDTFASLTTQPTCSTTYTQGASVSGSPYPSSCSGATSTNYSISYANGSVTVNQALLTITASSHTVSYGDAAPTITASYSGFVNGDTAPATLPTCLTTYAQGSPVSGSTYSSSCSGAADPNYSISYAPGTVSVNKASQIITFGALGGKTYGNADFSISASSDAGLAVSFSSLTPSVCTVIPPPASVVVSGWTVHIVGAGECTIHAIQAGNDNYEAANAVDRSFVVAKFTPTVTVTGGTYFFDTFAHPATGDVLGVGGVSIATPVFAYAPGGSSAPVTVGTYSVSGSFAENGNYNSATSSSPATITINKADQTIENFTQTPQSIPDKYFGSPDFDLLALVPTPRATSGLDLTFTATSTRLDGTPLPGLCDIVVVSGNPTTRVHIAGEGRCTITAHQAGNSNYNPAMDKSSTFTILTNTDNVSVSITDPVTHVTRATLPPSGPVTIDIPITVGDVTNHGFTSFDFTVSYDSTLLTPAASTVSSPNLPVVISSGDVASSFGFTSNVLSNPSPNGRLAVSGSGTTPLSSPVTGGRLLLLQFTANSIGCSDITFGSPNTFFFNGNTNPVTITTGRVCVAEDTTTTVSFGSSPFPYTGTLYTATATVTGNRTGATLTTPAAVVTPSGDCKNVTTTNGCSATASFAGDDTHNASPVGSASITITKTPLTVTANPQTRQYRATDPTFDATISGYVNGEVFGAASSGVTGAPVCTSTATPTSLVGTYPITCVIGTLAASNYSFPTFADGTLTISQATQTIMFGGLGGKTYGDTDFDVSATASSGLTVSFASTTTSVCTVSGVSVHLVSNGLCNIRASQGGDSTTYSAATDVDQSFTVSQKPISVSVVVSDKQYDTTTAATITSSTPNGIVNGDIVTVDYSLATATFNTASAGSNKPVSVTGLVLSGADAGKYSFGGTASTMANITQKSLTVTADNKTRSYGADNPAFTTIITGFIAPDTVSNSVVGSPSCTTTATPTTPVINSPVAITCSEGNPVTLTSNNYSFMFVDGSLTITQADQSINFAALSNMLIGSADFDVSATVTAPTSGGSTNPVTFSSSTTSVCTVSGSTVHLVYYGQCTITASKLGDGNYNDAMPVQQSFNVIPYTTDRSVSLQSPTTTPFYHGETYPFKVSVSDLSFHAISSVSFDLTYNPAVWTPATTPSSCVAVSGCSIVTTTNPSSGRLHVTIQTAGGTYLSGSGTLVSFSFVASNRGSGDFTISSFTFNSGTPAANPVSNLSTTVINGDISGTIRNFHNGRVVPGVTLSAADLPLPSSSPFSVLTDSSGVYTLSGFGDGSYTVTPSKPNETRTTANSNSSILPDDVSYIQRHRVGLCPIPLDNTGACLDPWTPKMEAAADVDLNGFVQSFDAALIQQFRVGIPNALNHTGQWNFTDVSKTYTTVRTPQTAENYTALLLGDVNGTWRIPGSPLVNTNPTQSEKSDEKSFPTEYVKPEVANVAPLAIGVALPTGTISAGTTVTQNVTVGDMTGQNVTSYDFDVIYNPAVVEPTMMLVDKNSTLSSNMSVVANIVSPGRLAVSASGINPLSGSGVLVKIVWRAVGNAGDTSPLTFDPFIFNGGTPSAVVTNGQIQITGPTAANVAVSGKVVNSQGNAVTRATVILTNSRGASQSVISNIFGNFSFGSVLAGETYTVSVRSKGYQFAPQVVRVSDTVTDLVLSAAP